VPESQTAVSEGLWCAPRGVTNTRQTTRLYHCMHMCNVNACASTWAQASTCATARQASTWANMRGVSTCATCADGSAHAQKCAVSARAQHARTVQHMRTKALAQHMRKKALAQHMPNMRARVSKHACTRATECSTPNSACTCTHAEKKHMRSTPNVCSCGLSPLPPPSRALPIHPHPSNCPAIMQ
jgi:hypothetical protein